MNDELKRRIADDLRKAGFESEMLAIDEFAKRDWQCEGSVGYRDRDQDVSREVDLFARFGLARMRNGGGTVHCAMRIVGEVKKSERPWVVLRERPLDKDQLIDAWNNLTYSANLPADQFALAEPLSKHSLLQRNGWRGRSVHESFKAPAAASHSYGAFVSATKASESALEAEEAELAPLRSAIADPVFFTLIKPVVVVDGPLASATITSDGSIAVEEIEAAVLRFQYRTAHYTRQNYSIDLVTLAFLPHYLALSEQRVRHFLDALAEPASDSGGGR